MQDWSRGSSPTTIIITGEKKPINLIYCITKKVKQMCPNCKFTKLTRPKNFRCAEWSSVTLPALKLLHRLEWVVHLGENLTLHKTTKMLLSVLLMLSSGDFSMFVWGASYLVNSVIKSVDCRYWSPDAIG